MKKCIYGSFCWQILVYLMVGVMILLTAVVDSAWGLAVDAIDAVLFHLRVLR